MPLRILVPITHSEESERALEFAIENFPDAEMTILHVFNPAVHYGGEGYVDERVLKNEREQAEQLLEDAETLAADHDIDVETVLEHGETKRLIIEYASEHDIDQIIMGSRGRSGVARLFLGSVAEGVVRRATVPVTVVK